MLISKAGQLKPASHCAAAINIATLSPILTISQTMKLIAELTAPNFPSGDDIPRANTAAGNATVKPPHNADSATARSPLTAHAKAAITTLAINCQPTTRQGDTLGDLALIAATCSADSFTGSALAWFT